MSGAICEMREAKGFTLLELLIAMAIFSVLVTGSYSLLRSVRTTHEAADAIWTRLDSLQRTQITLQKDFFQLARRPVRNELGEREAALFAGSAGEVSFTRHGWRNFTGAPRSDLQRVRYRFEGGRLLRQYRMVLDPAAEPLWHEQLVQDNLTELDFRFMDDKRRWHTTWPPVGARQQERFQMLPAAVEIRFEHEKLGFMVQRITGVSASVQTGSAVGAGGASAPSSDDSRSGSAAPPAPRASVPFAGGGRRSFFPGDNP